MSQHQVPGAQSQLSTALALMIEALRLLDELEAPGEIASQLDLAVARLERRLGIDHPVPELGAFFSPLAAELYADDERLGDSLSAWSSPSP